MDSSTIDEARQLNRDIFETIYHAAVEESMIIAKTRHKMIREENASQSQIMFLFSHNFPTENDENNK